MVSTETFLVVKTYLFAKEYLFFLVIETWREKLAKILTSLIRLENEFWFPSKQLARFFRQGLHQHLHFCAVDLFSIPFFNRSQKIWQPQTSNGYDPSLLQKQFSRSYRLYSFIRRSYNIWITLKYEKLTFIALKGRFVWLKIPKIAYACGFFQILTHLSKTTFCLLRHYLSGQISLCIRLFD